MNNLFNGAESFNQYIGDWNTSNVSFMGLMFYNAYFFNQNISNWNTSKVDNMQQMFENALSFNQDLSSWNVERVLSCSGFASSTYTEPKPNFTNCDPN